MSKLVKLVLILILVGISIILTVSVIALQYILNQKKSEFRQIRKKGFRTRNDAEISKKDLFLPDNVDDETSNNDIQHPHSTSQLKSKVIGVKKSSYTIHPQEIKLRNVNSRIAPNGAGGGNDGNLNSNIIMGESHLGLALRDIPFELHDTQYYYNDSGGSESSIRDGGSTSNNHYLFSSKFGGNAIPAELKYGSIVSQSDLQQQEQQWDDGDDQNLIRGGGIKRRGVEFVKLENPIMAKDGNMYEKKRQDLLMLKEKSKGEKQFILSSLSRFYTWVSSITLSSSRKKKRLMTTKTKNTKLSSAKFETERSILYHLQKASEYGNHHAQNMIANSLASGILPINNDPAIRQYLNITLDIPSDFASLVSDSKNGNQLSKAIILWHMSAMEGNVESLLALGYRHYISATSKNSSMDDILVHDADLNANDFEKHNIRKISSNDANFAPGKNKKTRSKHSARESDHYGVLGTCESALAYYEEAANNIIDEMESGPLRAKVIPAQDTHILPEIRQHGSSSALSQNNKPDELDEALKFLETRAMRKQDPDAHAAYKLATFYHYGLQGVKQDMKLALKYYEVCASMNSWECAGQAGKFYLWGIGMEDEDRDFKKALKYFKIGMPGGISKCEERLISKRRSKPNTKDIVDDDSQESDTDDDGDDDVIEDLLSELLNTKIHLCDHPSINGMGLLYVFGVPDLLKPNLRAAVRHFQLGVKMGNPDSMYNLAMIKLGWMNPFDGKLFKSNHASDFLEALNLLIKSADMSHIQAIHRLGMIYSKGFGVGNVFSIDSDCEKALSLFKNFATTMGTTVTKRMRAAYKQYMDGDFESSLRNYLVAAESGSIGAQVNAAFLLEEGHCLGLSHLQCMKASVRLWRAAARMGNEEASLKVGDFYFYGKLREDVDFDETSVVVIQRDIEFSVSPVPWARYILYPEDLIPKARKAAIELTRSLLERHNRQRSYFCQTKDCDKGSCCVNPKTHPDISQKYELYSKEQREHFKIAAKYYRSAATDLQSARANFNLGFMHEWGLGLAQDFPLAKRYYDLSSDAARNAGAGALANQIALFFMKIHEGLVKLNSSFDARYEQQGKEINNAQIIHEILQYHIVQFDTAVIFILILILVILLQYRETRQKQQ